MLRMVPRICLSLNHASERRASFKAITRVGFSRYFHGNVYPFLYFFFFYIYYDTIILCVLRFISLAISLSGACFSQMPEAIKIASRA